MTYNPQTEAQKTNPIQTHLTLVKRPRLTLNMKKQSQIKPKKWSNPDLYLSVFMAFYETNPNLTLDSGLFALDLLQNKANLNTFLIL
jgi:hypothetical protein